MTPELTNYIQTQIARGVSKETIIDELVTKGGWELGPVEDAFAAMVSVNVSSTAKVLLPDSLNTTKPPVSIKYFEYLMYVSVLANLGLYIFQFIQVGDTLEVFDRLSIYTIINIFGTSIIGLCIIITLVYLIVRKRTEWAKIVLTILFVLSVLFGLQTLLIAFNNPIILLLNIPLAIEAFAFYFLYSPSSTAWLSSNIHPVSISGVLENKKWSKIIPRINQIFLVISMLLVFGLDLFILFSSPDLAPFFFAMLAVFVIFIFFYLTENRKLSQTFSGTESTLDTWFIALVVVRDVVFVLNFIPFIQILGGAALILGGIPYLVVYFFLLYKRRSKV